VLDKADNQLTFSARPLVRSNQVAEVWPYLEERKLFYRSYRIVYEQFETTTDNGVKTSVTVGQL